MRAIDCRKCTFHKSKGQTPPAHDWVKIWKAVKKPWNQMLLPLLYRKLNPKMQKWALSSWMMTVLWWLRFNKLFHIILLCGQIKITQKSFRILPKYVEKKSTKCSQPKLFSGFRSVSHMLLSKTKEIMKDWKSLAQIVPHASGHYTACHTWYGYKSNPDKYKHKSLPYGKKLSREQLKIDLQNNIWKLHQKYWKNCTMCFHKGHGIL